MGINLVSRLGKLTVVRIGFCLELALLAGLGSQIFISSHLLSEEVWVNQFESRKKLVELFTIKEHSWNKSDIYCEVAWGKIMSKMIAKMLKYNFSVNGFCLEEAQIVSCELFLPAWHDLWPVS